MSVNSSSSSSSRPQSPMAPSNAFYGSYAEVNFPLTQLGEHIEQAINIVSNFTSQINNNENDHLNDREFLLQELGINQIERKFRQLRQEFYTHVDRTSNDVLRFLSPSYQSSSNEDIASVETNVVDFIDLTVAPTMEGISSEPPEANVDEAVVWVSTLYGYAKCRLCKIDCPEFTRTDMYLTSNIDASVLCSACFQRLVPSLMSIDC